jgi:hypothetical protein
MIHVSNSKTNFVFFIVCFPFCCPFYLWCQKSRSTNFCKPISSRTRMSSILVGSSNIARFYRADAFKKFRPYTLMRCTEFSSFKSTMEDFTVSEKNLVLSVIENFEPFFVFGNVKRKQVSFVPIKLDYCCLFCFEIKHISQD